VFHAHNNYVSEQVQHSKVLKPVLDQQPRGMIKKRQEQLFLQLFIHTSERLLDSMAFHIVEYAARSLLTL
jgi:hypothetical protein